MNSKNGWLKKLAVALIMTMLLATVAACAGNKNNTASPTPGASPAASAGAESSAPASSPESSAETAPFIDGKYDPPIPMNIVMAVSDNIQYFNGDTAEKNILFEVVKENLGIDMNVLWSAPTKNEGFKTKLLLSLSSGEQLPDVVNTGTDKDLTNQLIESGKFMDLTDLFEQYASSEIKRIYDENPDLFLSVTRNGRFMALPIPAWGPNGPPIMFVRQDWLDNLELKAPANIAELEQVMDAFVNRDPDGNGKKDTFGMAVQLKDPAGGTMGDATALFGAFGAIPGIWSKSADGQSLVYDSVRPEMKEALSAFRGWMEKGYISKDAPQQDGGTATALYTAGQAGIVFGPNWMPYVFPELVPVTRPYPIPTDANGKALRRANPLLSATVLINKNYAHPDAVFHYAEALRVFGSHGEIWNVTDEFLRSNGYMDPAQGTPFSIAKYGVIPEFFIDPWEQVNGYLDYMLENKPGRSPGEQKVFDNCRANPVCIDGQIQAMKTWRAQADADVINLYSGPVTETQNTQGDFLNKLEYETQMKIIFGTSPVDEFDSFVERWKKGGGDKITEEVNAWYKGNVLK